MTEHTKGPWRVEQDTTLIWGACDPDDKSTYGMGYSITECRTTPAQFKGKGPYLDEGEANAARIVACVNALEGYNPDAVRDVVDALELFERCAYPVCQTINPRGHNWMPEERLDYALTKARAALTRLGSAA